MYQVASYGKLIDQGNFNDDRTKLKTYLQNGQPKYITNRLRGGINGEEKWGGAIVFTNEGNKDQIPKKRSCIKNYN